MYNQILKCYNKLRYISLHYATGPNVIHGGTRSYFLFFVVVVVVLNWPE